MATARITRRNLRRVTGPSIVQVSAELAENAASDNRTRILPSRNRTSRRNGASQPNEPNPASGDSLGNGRWRLGSQPYVIPSKIRTARGPLCLDRPQKSTATAKRSSTKEDRAEDTRFPLSPCHLYRCHTCRRRVGSTREFANRLVQRPTFQLERPKN